MEINAQTKLTDILDKYPWLPDELAKLDGRFKISLQGDSLAASFASSCEKYPRKSLSTFYLRLV